MKRIAVVCRTEDSLELDDRIRKECTSLSKAYELFIYVVFEDNRAEEGVTSYGVKYKSFALKSREKHRAGGALLSKAWDFYKTVKPYLSHYDYIWAAEEYTFLFAALAPKGRLIWDLHELPSMMMKTPLTRILFHYIEKKSKIIIHANDERIEYLVRIGLVKKREKHYSIHNYPDDSFLESQEKCIRYSEFTDWSNGEKYIYLQGLNIPSRYPYNTIKALLDKTALKILVVGRFDPSIETKLKSVFGESFNERVFMMGTIPSLQIPVLMKNSMFSVVFYNTDSPNNRYCEANRFYNAISLGVPVIVGCNESMANICRRYGVGIPIETDGRVIEDIENGVTRLINDYNTIKKQCLENLNIFRWKDEFVLTEDIFERI